MYSLFYLTVLDLRFFVILWGLAMFLCKHYCFGFSFSFFSLGIHFISFKKKDERELFYFIVCIQNSFNFSNGDTRS